MATRPIPIRGSRLSPPDAKAFSSLAPFGSSPRSPEIARAFEQYFSAAAGANTTTASAPGGAAAAAVVDDEAPTAAPIRLSAVSPAPGGGESADALLSRVMSLNVRYDTAADGPDAWAYRLDDLADLVATYHPLVAGLQEALAGQVYQLESRLAVHGYRWVGVGRDDGHAAGEFCPIFYDAERLQLDDWHSFWLSGEPDRPGSKHADAALPRLCTWARLQRRSGAHAHRPFYVFNTHFDHQSAAARAFSARLLLDKIAQIAGLYAAVVVGDLNCTRAEPTYATMVSSFLRDSFVEGPQPGDDSPTFTGFRIDSDDSTAYTIDYILVSGFHVAGYKVLRERRRNGRRISDHRPVVADILLESVSPTSS